MEKIQEKAVKYLLTINDILSTIKSKTYSDTDPFKSFNSDFSNLINSFSNKDSTLKVYLESNGFNCEVTKEDLKNLKIIFENQKENLEDCELLLFIYYCIIWAIDITNLENVSLFVSFLNEIKVENFIELLNDSFALFINSCILKMAEFTKNDITDIYEFILTHRINESFISVCPQLFKYTIMNHPNLKNLSLSVMMHMFEDNLEISVTTEEKIARFLMPLATELDTSSLNVLSAFMKTGISHNIIKTITSNLALSLFHSFFNDGETQIKKEKENEQKHFYQWIFDFELIHNNSKVIQCFNEPNTALLGNSYDLMSIISDDMKTKVKSMATFLDSNTEQVNDVFFSTFIEYIKNLIKSPHFNEVVSVFFFLLQENTNQKLIEKYISLFSNSPLFNPNENVFEENSISEETKILRNAMFKHIVKEYPNSIILLLKSLKENTFLVVEVLLRVLAFKDAFDWSYFMNDEVLRIILRTTIDIRSVAANDGTKYEEERKTCLIFLKELALNESTAEKCFSYSEYINSFLQALFEFDVHKIVLDCVKLNFMKTKEKKLKKAFLFISDSLLSCINHIELEEYRTVGNNICTTLYSILIERKEFVKFNYELIYRILEFSKKTKQKDILYNCIQLLKYNPDIIESYTAALDQYISTIKEIEGDEISDTTFNFIIKLIGGDFAEIDISLPFILKNPCCIPLFFGAIGKSKYMNKMLKYFLILAEESNSNALVLHEGFCDFLLAKAVFYNGHLKMCFKGALIEIELTQFEIIRYVFPFLKIIGLALTDFSIIKTLVESIHVASFCPLILDHFYLLCNEHSSTKFPVFEVTDENPKVVFKRILWNELSDGFSISFSLSYDFFNSSNNNICLNIFNLHDKYYNSFIVAIKDQVLMLYYITEDFISQVTLSRTIYQSRNMYFLLMFAFKNGGLSISTFIDNKFQSLTDFCNIDFADNILDAEIGFIKKYQMTEEVPNYSIYASISDFALYRSSDLYQKKFKSIDNLSELAYIKTYGTRNSANEKNGLFSPTKRNSVVYTDSVNNDSVVDILKSSDIIDTLISLLSSSHKLKGEQIACVFDILALIFSYSEEAQKDFKYFPSIFTSLTALSKELSSTVYIAVKNCLNYITVPSFCEKWLQNVVLNIFIWSLTDSNTFSYAINDWSKNIVANYSDFFKKNNMFGPFFDKFCLYFSFLEEENRVQEFAIFPRHYDKNILKCRDMFGKFLLRIGTMNFTDDNAEIVFNYLSVIKSQVMITYLLNLLLTLKINKYTTERAACLLSLLGISNTITKLALLLMHDFSGNYVHINMLIATKKIKPTRELFDILIGELPKRPNIYQVLCFIAVNLGEEEKHILATNLHMLANKDTEDLAPTKCWHFMLISLAISTNINDSALVCQFMAVMLKHSDSFVAEFNYILNIISAISLKERGVSRQLLQSVLLISKNTNLDFIAEISFMNAFFSFKPPSHSAALVNLFNESVFREKEKFEPIVCNQKFEFLSIDDFKEFFSHDYSLLEIRFSISIDANESWPDLYIAQILSGASISEDMNDFFNYFANKFISHERTATNSLSQSSIQIFKEIATTQMINSLKKGFSDFEELTEIEKEIQNIDFKYSQNKVLCRIADESSILTSTVNFSHQESLYFRDLTLCNNFYLAKYSREEFNFQNPEISLDDSEPIFANKCALYLFGYMHRAHIRIFDSFFIIDVGGSQIIMNKILYFTANDMAFSVFSSYRCFYFILIDADQQSFSTCIKLLSKMMIHNAIPQPIATDTFYSTVPILTEEWLNKEISNLDYIMNLNFAAGRAYHSKANYPIVPSVVSSFDSYRKLNDISKAVKKSQISTLRITNFPDNEMQSLKNLLEESQLLPPELFYYPLSVIEKDTLPEWADTKESFIYKHRKLLNSQEVASVLHLWIDEVFGIKMNTKLFKHQKLFNEKHPRIIKDEESVTKLSQFKIPIKDAVAAKISIPSPRCLEICLMCSNNSFIVGNVLLNNNKATLNAVEEDYEKNDEYINSYSYKGKTYLIPNDYSSITKVEKNLQSPIKMSSNLICNYNDTVLYSEDRCTLTVYPNKVLCRTESAVVALNSSTEFQIIVYATIDCKIFVRNFGGKIVNSTDVNEMPKQIIIGKKTGFILILTKKSLFLLNVNGELISRFDNEFLISSMYNVEANFTDYVAFESTNNKIGYFEMFYPNVVNIFYESKSPVRDIEYNEKGQYFILLTSSGSIKLVPLEI